MARNGPVAGIWELALTIRLSDTTLVFVGTLIGARLSGFPGTWPATAFGVASSNALLCAASMAFNDWHDLPEDRINKPSRPLPAGRVDRRQLLWLAGALFAAGILVGAALRAELGLMGLAITALSVGYSIRLKQVPILGNLVVALVVAYPLWCWLVVGAPGHPAYLALIACLATFRFGAEMIKTAEDAPGDAACGIRTVATTLGPAAAMRLGCAVMGLAAVIAWWPVALGEATPLYIVPIGAATALVTAGSLLSVRAPVQAQLAARLVRLERVAMVLGALGFGLGLR